MFPVRGASPSGPNPMNAAPPTVAPVAAVGTARFQPVSGSGVMRPDADPDSAASGSHRAASDARGPGQAASASRPCDRTASTPVGSDRSGSYRGSGANG